MEQREFFLQKSISFSSARDEIRHTEMHSNQDDDNDDEDDDGDGGDDDNDIGGVNYTYLISKKANW